MSSGCYHKIGVALASSLVTLFGLVPCSARALRGKAMMAVRMTAHMRLLENALGSMAYLLLARQLSGGSCISESREVSSGDSIQSYFREFIFMVELKLIQHGVQAIGLQ